MSYQQIICELEKYEQFGIRLGLHRVKELLRQINYPQRSFPSILVGGTNGKGSVCVFLSSVLQQAGYRVGLYTSPHISDYSERICVNNKPINRKKMQDLLKIVLNIANKMKEKPTLFEILTAVAFLHFKNEKVEIVVLEVGLGGRLDATNIVDSILSIITNVDFDHTKYLGKKIAQIAREKAGIIKKGTTVITGEKKPEALQVISRKARQKKSPLIISKDGKIKHKIKLEGSYQEKNISIVLDAIRYLRKIKWRIKPIDIEKGFRKANWPGRFQVVKRKPWLILDAAHNPAGMDAFIESLKEVAKEQRFTFIFGCQKYKDYQRMLEKIIPLADKIILTRSSHKLSASPFDLGKILKKRGVVFSVAPNFSQALMIVQEQKPMPNIAVVGSIFLISEAVKMLNC